MDLYDRIQSSNFALAQSTLAFVTDCVAQFGLPHLALSFNGGKDCTVLLHLLLAALAHLRLPVTELTVLYFNEADQFAELKSFMRRSERLYGLTVLRLESNYRDALTQLFAERTVPIKAIFMGQRRSDPHTQSLSQLTPSSVNYPSFVRINPLLEWGYSDVWRFLLEYGIEYCQLYDRGYTSIGNRSNSRPNPRLWNADKGLYEPAWRLLEIDSDGDAKQLQFNEREGREDFVTQNSSSSDRASESVNGAGADSATSVPCFHDGEALHRLSSVGLAAADDESANDTNDNGIAAATVIGAASAEIHET